MVLFGLLIQGCYNRIGNVPIPKVASVSGPRQVFSPQLSEEAIDNLDEAAIIQYLKLHEESAWTDISKDEILNCVSQNPNNADVLELVSAFYLNRSDLEKALEYTEAAELNGANSTEFFKKRADVYMALGDYGLAIDYLNKAVNINQNDPDIYLAKGEVYLKLKDSASALMYKERAFVHDSSRKEVAFDLAHIYASVGAREKADLLADYLIHQSYHTQAMYFLKIKMMRRVGQHIEANHLLKSLMDQGNLEAGEDLISFFLLQKAYDSAIHYSTQVLMLDSANMKALQAKASSFDFKGYYNSSLMYYEQMLVVDSLNEEALEGVRKVNGKIAYLRKLKEQREAIPTFDFATEKKETN